MCENCREKAFAGNQAFSCSHKLVQEPAAGFVRTIPEDCLQRNWRLFKHHRAGFGDSAFARIKFYFYILHVLAENLVVDFVGVANARRRRQLWRRTTAGAEFVDVGDRNPFRKPLSPTHGGWILAGLNPGSIGIHRPDLLPINR